MVFIVDMDVFVQVNLYFSKGRSTTKDGKTVYERRNWYEVEVTSLLAERKKYKDYPIGEFTAYVEDNGKYNSSLLIQASNYLTSKFTNKNISQIKRLIQSEIKN